MEQRYHTRDACGQAGRRRWRWLQESRWCRPRVICGVDPVAWTMKDDNGIMWNAGKCRLICINGSTTSFSAASIHALFQQHPFLRCRSICSLCSGSTLFIDLNLSAILLNYSIIVSFKITNQTCVTSGCFSIF